MTELNLNEIKTGTLIGVKEKGYLQLYLLVGVEETVDVFSDTFRKALNVYEIETQEEFNDLIDFSIQLNVYHIGVFKLDGDTLCLEEETHNYIKGILNYLLERTIDNNWLTTLSLYDSISSRIIYKKIEIEEDKIKAWILKNKIVDSNIGLNLLDLSDTVKNISDKWLLQTKLGLGLNFNTFLQNVFLKDDKAVQKLEKGDVVYKKLKNRIKFYVYLEKITDKNILVNIADTKYKKDCNYSQEDINIRIKPDFYDIRFERYANNATYYTTNLNVYTYYSKWIDEMCNIAKNCYNYDSKGISKICK